MGDTKGAENMLDLNHMERYREGNRLEAKLATGGLPRSIWETYSAFANSAGGIILLGVEELPDHSLRVQGLLEPHEMIQEFWEQLNDPAVVSMNILRPEDVWVAGTDDGSVVVIQVPQGERDQLPVYLGRDFFTPRYSKKTAGLMDIGAAFTPAALELAGVPCVLLMQMTRWSSPEGCFRALRFSSALARSTISTFPKTSGSSSICFRMLSYSDIIRSLFFLSLMVLAILLIRASSLRKRWPSGLVIISVHRFRIVFSLSPVNVLPSAEPTLA